MASSATDATAIAALKGVAKAAATTAVLAQRAVWRAEKPLVTCAQKVVRPGPNVNRNAAKGAPPTAVAEAAVSVPRASHSLRHPAANCPMPWQRLK